MLNRIKAWLHRPRFVPNALGVCSFSVSSSEILFSYASRKGQQLELQLCEKLLLPKNGNIVSVLSPLVEKLALKQMPCIWILNQEDYQLFLMESLPVEPSEFQSAIRWKMKGLLSFELNDAVIDQFPMPLQKTANPQKMMNVVVARQSFLQKVTQQIEASGLMMQIIDIPELSLRNVTAHFEADGRGSALIYLQEQSGQLIITRQKELYFSRRIDFDVNFFNTRFTDANVIAEKIALEVQRSFDYYQGQWRSQIPEQIFLMLPKMKSKEITDALSNYLGSPVTELSLDEVIPVAMKSALEQKSEFLPLIGGLLREGAYAARN